MELNLLKNNRLIIVYCRKLRKCKVTAVLDKNTVALDWIVKPPGNEGNPFNFHFMLMTDEITEWSIHGYDSKE